MSHTTTLKTIAIKDIAAVRAAVAKMRTEGVQCSLVQNAVPRMYYQNQHGVCDYVIKLDDSPYDVGLDRQEDGTYLPVFDSWDGKVESQLGPSCPVTGDPAQRAIGKFLQYYATEAAVNQAAAQGYYVESTEIDSDGNVQLILGV